MDRVVALILVFVPSFLLAGVCAYFAVTESPFWLFGIIGSMILAPSVEIK